MKSPLFKGALFVIFGLLILINPSGALVLLATYFGILAIITGLFNFYMAWRDYKKNIQHSFWVFEGIVSLLIGLIIISFPQKSISFFIVLFGIYALIAGILQLRAYFRVRAWNIKSGSLLFSAVFSLIVAAVLLFKPFESAGLIAIFIAVFAVIYGVSTIINAT